MKNIVFVIFILVALTSDAFSQQIRGTVSSDDGPIVGATVLIKGTTVGTTTDMEGNFLIEANDNRSTYVLKVSTVGYETVEREVQADVDSDIVLSSSNVLIEEITVTGYRKSRTSNGQLDNAFSKIPVEQRYQTQAVSKLSLEDLQDQRIQGLDQAAALAPGFTFAESRGNSFVRINVRGLSATYLYNGIRLESNVRSGEGNINFNIVDNVEFINGSSGVGYGNISPGGAVNVNSKHRFLISEEQSSHMVHGILS